ncbi:MAG TPA: 16S rRNA (guanine(527)-N(7))-methyltransferase RsmG [Castellaniella sp.]|uniref:16S rRNA (guanine(527)-N(7))-methyltransferase RsmG n=1 Tax=Castellaniella sp. TaxID=1955812 RepID=UPI002EEA0AA9
MSDSQPVFRDRLASALRELGMEGDEPRIPALLHYLAELERWNRAYNLTAVRDPSQMLVQHVFDSLSVVPELRAFALGRVLHVADIGSGGGLPGIILGICEPQWTVVCVDAVGKKTAFIRQAAGVLALPHVKAVHARAETLDSLQADVVISRAFASLEDFIHVASHHCAPTGRLFAMKGQFPQEEQRALESDTPWRVLRTLPLQVPEMNAHRCLLELGPKDIHD